MLGETSQVQQLHIALGAGPSEALGEEVRLQRDALGGDVHPKLGLPWLRYGSALLREVEESVAGAETLGERAEELDEDLEVAWGHRPGKRWRQRGHREQLGGFQGYDSRDTTGGGHVRGKTGKTDMTSKGRATAQDHYCTQSESSTRFRIEEKWLFG
eukprot:Skav235838  [mRNA]  locus=scaffold1931:284503:292084:- [translate_table: standard]